MDGERSEIRPLPLPPHCRGIPLGDGEYTGCAYGYGDLLPLTGPCDCPTCCGSGFEGVVGTLLPHSCFGDPYCCGCLNGVIREHRADIVCNDCGAVVQTVPPADLQRTLDEMELTLEIASAECPQCGAVNLPRFSKLLVFTCKQCGEVVKLADDPNIEPLFGSL